MKNYSCIFELLRAYRQTEKVILTGGRQLRERTCKADMSQQRTWFLSV
jgi:hypothetical protein